MKSYYILVVGDPKSGKSYLPRLCSNDPNQAQMTATYWKKFQYESKQYQFVAAPHGAIYISALKFMLARANIILLVYSITSRSTYQSILKYLQYIEENPSNNNPCILLVGNNIQRIDQERVHYQQVRDLARINPFWDFVFVSTKQQSGFQRLFEKAVQLIKKKQEIQSQQSKPAQNQKLIKQKTSKPKSNTCAN